MNSRAPARILFLHPSNELYGADLALLYLLRGLDRSRFEPLVILANDIEYSGLLSQELQASGIESRSLPIAVARRRYLSPVGLPRFLRRLSVSVRMVADIIEREQIEIVHSNTLAVWTGALAAKRTGRPHIWHVHESLENPRQLVMLMRHFVPSYSVRVVGVSHAVLENILVTPETRAKGQVIYNGKEPDVWMSASGRDQVRQELGCGPEDVVVGMVARVSKMKAPDLCVQAVAPLMARYPQLHCFIAGGPVPGQTEPLDELRQLVARSPAPERFHLLGERRDAPSLMAAMDILAAPSRYGEGASLTIIQAMFASKPVIATDVGGNKELVANEETGWIIPRNNIKALSDAMESLVNDPRRRAEMGMAGQRRAMEHFTLDRAVAQFNEMLSCIQEKRAVKV
jgi:glycosyltransferase involved in cell wall biosynthesis